MRMELDKQDVMDMRVQLARIEAKLDDIPEIKQSMKETTLRMERQAEKTDKAYTMGLANEKAIAKLESKYEWLSRTVVGAIIAGISTAIIRLIFG